MTVWHLGLLGIAAIAEPGAGELVLTPGEPVLASINGLAVRLHVESGGLNWLTLDADYVAANSIQPENSVPNVRLSVAKRSEFQGHSRPMAIVVAGRAHKVRGFWFEGAPDSGVDGRVGPWGLPQPRITFALAPAQPSEARWRLPLYGSATTGAYGGIVIGRRHTALAFAIENNGRLPVATAALGASIAKTYGGRLEGASWDVEVVMGVKRPVRLLRLKRPMAIGPLSFDKIAVRVRDRIDASGRGAPIVDTTATIDPEEIIVTSAAGGPAPMYVLTIPRAGLGQCSRLTYNKSTRRLDLMCKQSNN